MNIPRWDWLTLQCHRFPAYIVFIFIDLMVYSIVIGMHQLPHPWLQTTNLWKPVDLLFYKGLILHVFEGCVWVYVALKPSLFRWQRVGLKWSYVGYCLWVNVNACKHWSKFISPGPYSSLPSGIWIMHSAYHFLFLSYLRYQSYLPKIWDRICPFQLWII